MRKILLGLGMIMAVSSPIIAVVSCGETIEKPHKGSKVKINKPVIETGVVSLRPPRASAVKVDTIAPVWSISSIPVGIVPSELGSGYITHGNKDLTIQLTGTQTTFNASSIISQIKANTKLIDETDKHVSIMGSFPQGINVSSLSLGEHVYTLSASDSSGNHSLIITYTFKVVQSLPMTVVNKHPIVVVSKPPTPIVNKPSTSSSIKIPHVPITSMDDWNTYLDDPSNGFSTIFIGKAKQGITWVSAKLGKIKASAFEGVHFPATFILPNVVEIGDNAFKRATLPSKFSIPESTIKFGTNIFNNAIFPSSGTLTLPSTMTKIPEYMFQHATLPMNFVIPSSITTIGFAAFNKVIFPLKCLFRIPTSVTKIEMNAFAFARVPDGFKIPSSVTTIEKWAFANTNLPNSFVVPLTVTNLHTIAFTDSKNRDGSLYVLKRT
ncbi:MAG: leucine-rich repeat domain-containing protein [Mycoplasmataceae bacterium]|nr:leucine-rich repeat domain-containing protein [Mycoplasmataceae bacterium]